MIKLSVADGSLLILMFKWSFLSIASDNGYSTFGIEPNARESSRIRSWY